MVVVAIILLVLFLFVIPRPGGSVSIVFKMGFQNTITTAVTLENTGTTDLTDVTLGVTLLDGSGYIMGLSNGTDDRISPGFPYGERFQVTNTTTGDQYQTFTVLVNLTCSSEGGDTWERTYRHEVGEYLNANFQHEL